MSSRLAHSFRESEIEHLHDAAWCDLDVRRFQIAVNDPFVVCRLERVGDLAGDGDCFIQPNRTACNHVRDSRSINEF